MPRSVTHAEAVAEAGVVAARSPERTVWIGIDGFGAAGKSTLAAAVAAELPRASIVQVDDFWGPSIPEWDWDRFNAQVAAPLQADATAEYQVWDWVDDQPGEWRAVPSGRVVVVEGVSSTRAEVRVSWDLTVWVEAPRSVRLERAVARDGESMLPRWLEDWMPSEEAYAERERPWERVDLIVSGRAVDHGRTR